MIWGGGCYKVTLVQNSKDIDHPVTRKHAKHDTNRIAALMRARRRLGSLVRPPASCLEWRGA